MKKTLLILILPLYTFYLAHSQSWKSVTSGVTGGPTEVRSFCEYDGKLYIGGLFFKAGGMPISCIASWDGTTWDSLGSGVTSGMSVKCMVVYNGRLYAGGQFINMGGVDWTNQIARWDGDKWESLGGTTSITSHISALVVYKNKLYAAGNFKKIGGYSTTDGLSVNRIACWNDTVWETVGTGVTGGFEAIYCMAVYKDELYVGGDFYKAGGKTAFYMAKWNGMKWDSLGGGGLNGVPGCMMVDTINDVLFVGGGFNKAGGKNVKGIAKWDGNKWDSVGNPVCGAFDFEIYNGLLIAGGSTVSVDDTVMACWNGEEWCKIGDFNSTISALQTYKNELYVGGYFETVNGDSVNYIIRYSGLQKNTLDSIPPSCINNPAFTLAGGNPAGGVYSGNGISGNTFDPALAGLGVHEITYAYYDADGCTNVPAVTNITVNALPVVSLDLVDSVCVNSASVVLTGGSPPGGIYSGTGVSGNVFDPATADTGINTIAYSYTDSNNCTNTVTSEIYVDVCTGKNKFQISNFKFSIIPNPNIGLFTLTCPVPSKLEVYNGQGSLMYNQTNKKMVSELNLQELENGVYVFRVIYGEEIMVKRVVIKK